MKRDAWEEIAEEAIRSAEAVRCSISDFARGLKEVEEVVHERRLLAEDEAKAAGEEL